MLQQRVTQKELLNIINDWNFLHGPEQFDMLCLKEAIGDALEQNRHCNQVTENSVFRGV